MAVEWYYQKLEETIGPVSGQQLRKLAAQKVIMPWTPLRRVSGSDQSSWKRAGEIKGLFDRKVALKMEPPICEDCGAKLDGDTCFFLPPGKSLAMAEVAPPPRPIQI